MQNEAKDLSTEQKIIQAAQKLFSRKGYAATKTREIAEEAGTNLALLNYYFGSKEKLFKIIVEEKLRLLLGAMRPILSDEQVSLEEKIQLFIHNYTELLLENQDLPLFILNGISGNKDILEDIVNNIQHTVSAIKPTIEKQLKERGFNISAPNFIINMLGMTIFPFVAKPVFFATGLVNEDEFEELMLQRKDKMMNWMMRIME